MRISISLLALVAVPALAQNGTIEVQPLEPLIVPGITQNNDGVEVVRPVEPLVVPDVTGQSGTDGGAVTIPAPQPGENLSEGFNEGAFGEGEGSFIDRAFGTAPAPAEGEGQGLAAEPGNEQTATGNTWFGLEIGGGDEIESSIETSEIGEIGESGEGAGDDEDKPRFMAAPFTTRGLFGPNRPNALPKVATVSAESAEIRQLDKMTGATRTVTMKSGDELKLGRLRVRLEGCQAPPGGSTHGTVAFLRIWDPQQDKEEPVFSGWMFADSPALSALDHPRYDVWVLGCEPTRAAGAEPAEKEPGEG